MQLRHIRPGTVDWYDAMAEEGTPGAERLSPEEVLRLRALRFAEEIDSPTPPEPERKAEN